MEEFKKNIRSLKQQQYREKNKEKMKEYQKEYRKKNKDKIKEIVKCDKCGTYIQKNNLPKHKKTMICRKMWDSSLLNSDNEE